MTTIVTHSGSFHADDVFAVATLQLYLNDASVRVIRTRDDSDIAQGDWVVDVGGVYDPSRHRFDHHQPGAPIRENGLPYAAFGLVWRELGVAVSGSTAVSEKIESLLVQPVDAGDAGVNLYTVNDFGVPPFELYQIIRSFAPAWGSGESKDDAFLKAVAFARELLMRLIAQQKAVEAMDALVARTYEAATEKRVLVFDEPVSALAAVRYPEVEVVVCPDDPASNENWTATTVRQRIDSFVARASFPVTWGGLRGEALAAVSGIPDAVFCHKAGFIFVAGSKESARSAAALVEPVTDAR